MKSSTALYQSYKQALQYETSRQYKTDPLSSAGGSAIPHLSESLDREEPLEFSIRDQFERAFGVDLSSVRIHTGPTAEDMARQSGARAYTIGSHIYFAGGEYSSQTEEGIKLLAHELQHVIQSLKGSSMVYLEDRQNLENEAERVEALLDEQNLHNMDDMDLRQKGSMLGGTSHFGDQGGGLFKKPGASGADSLDDFVGNQAIPGYTICLNNGQKVDLKPTEYERLKDTLVDELEAWIKEEASLLSDEGASALITNYQKWLSEGRQL